MNHAEMVAALVKSPDTLLDEVSGEKINLNHAVLGIAGEAGELVDCIKKFTIYNKPLDRENLIEELGDMEFYLEQLRQATGITRDEALKNNMTKLSLRYENFLYTDQRAHERKDKQ